MMKKKNIMKNIYAEKRTRSANEPVISDGVMMANFIWNRAKSASGMDAPPKIFPAGVVYTSAPTFWNIRNVSGLPMMPPMSSPKHSENPMTTHNTEISPIAINDWSIVEITFFAPTMPP